MGRQIADAREPLSRTASQRRRPYRLHRRTAKLILTAFDQDAATTGDDWTDPAYDAAGNMRLAPDPAGSTPPELA